jgi:hypothetical protein
MPGGTEEIMELLGQDVWLPAEIQTCDNPTHQVHSLITILTELTWPLASIKQKQN